MSQPSSSESSPEHNLTDMGEFVDQGFADGTGLFIFLIQQRSKKRSKLNLNMRMMRMQILKTNSIIQHSNDLGYKTKKMNYDIGESIFKKY